MTLARAQGIDGVVARRSLSSRLASTVVVSALLLAGCSAGQVAEPPAEPTPVTPSPTGVPVDESSPDDRGSGDTPTRDVPSDVEVSEEQITDQKGNVLLSINALPDSVQPTPDTEFGGPTKFTDAELSDDGASLAIGSAGAVHSYGWLYDIAAQQHHLVAFQYGGSVNAHSWSPDNQFALFTVATPASTELLKVVDRNDIRSHAQDTGFLVEVDQEGDPPFAYEFTQWRDAHTLCFQYDGAPYCVDAETTQSQPVQ